MKYLLITITFWLASHAVSFAQIDLTIQISEFRNNNGKVLLEFKNENEDQLYAVLENIIDNKSTIVIADLKPGKYAFKFFHDENGDEKINTNFMGIPREGFGFSNDAKATFGPPSFDKMLFELTKSDTVRCEPTYMLKKK